MRVALVHEYLNQFGGAERLLQVLCSIFPNAPIFTLLYDKYATGHVFEGREIRTSFLNKIPFTKTHHHVFPLLMPLAIEQFDFLNFDLVISISASFAKGIITQPSTKHICYCLTPPRFLWDDSQRFVEEFGYPGFIKKFLPPFITYLRIWDSQASSRVDDFWAISDFIKSRIKKYYLKNAQVIYPPVDISKFYISDSIDNYFFMVGRLVSYKRFDIAVKAFSDLGLPLKIVGVGPEMKRLKKIAKKNIQFLGLIDDIELARLYSRSKALIFPQEEDFGIVPLEAMASGRPVIAFKGGGATETIVDGRTGIFFNEQNENALIQAVKIFDPAKFNSATCRQQAEKFDVKTFKDKISETLGRKQGT